MDFVNDYGWTKNKVLICTHLYSYVFCTVVIAQTAWDFPASLYKWIQMKINFPLSNMDSKHAEYQQAKREQ